MGRLITHKGKNLPLKKDPKYKCVVVWDISSITIDGLRINFEIYEGVFNINAFVRQLAAGECKRCLKGKPMPNILSVRVIRGRKLVGLKNPRVVLRVRDQSAKTKATLAGECPMWDQRLSINVNDPSAVMLIQVYDHNTGITDTIKGQWIMTLKYFIKDPYYNHHSKIDGEYNVDKNTGVIKGWIPLMNGRFDRNSMGKCGFLEVEMSWSHDSNAPLPPSRSLTALQQLTENSKETNASN